MSNKAKLLNYLENHNGLITYKDCKKLDVPTIYLTRLENEGLIFRVEKGIFLSSANDNYDEYFFFQYRFTKTIFSHVSALYLQGLTDEIPQYFEITIPRGYRFQNTPANLSIHVVPKKFSDIGIITVETPMGNQVQVYDFERTLCDFIRNRENIDSELFVKTLKKYGTYPKKDLAKLYEYAKKMNILEKIKRTMEILV
ncbi:MAG: type IV toxin-antitoxin system AbiEi family antitoxin domain-containing protein [Methanobrevibacter sp.]|nr:type IV toxin-antitoxin system AbiEi family antitoxin domain-containing protein [Methanobrevibacter sp.]